MKTLGILGASGHGCVVADAALLSGWSAVRFFDDRWPTLQTVGAWSVVGDTGALLSQASELDGVIVSIGDNSVRLRRFSELVLHGTVLATIVHPTAVISPFASIGEGCLIGAQSVVGPFAVVGDAAIVNTGATVDHHCRLAPGVHVSPGAHLGGNVTVGEASWIGIGAAVRQMISIGSHAVVGAGAAVVADVPDGHVSVGVPARPRSLHGSA